MLKREYISITKKYRHFALIQKLKLSSTDSTSNYNKTLLRKFLFYIHPDYFIKYENEKFINNSNLKILNEIIDNNKSYNDQNINLSSTSTSTRALTFFIKPIDTMNLPRRVKVSLLRYDYIQI